MTLETLAQSQFVVAILGGAVHGSVFGFKAYMDGESFDLEKLGLTVVLAAAIGVPLELAGVQPTTEQWFFMLAAYTGLVAELEALLKAVIRGNMSEARRRLDTASEEAGSATGDLMGAGGSERAVDHIQDNAPEGTIESDTDLDESFERAQRAENFDELDELNESDYRDMDTDATPRRFDGDPGGLSDPSRIERVEDGP